MVSIHEKINVVSDFDADASFWKAVKIPLYDPILNFLKKT